MAIYIHTDDGVSTFNLRLSQEDTRRMQSLTITVAGIPRCRSSLVRTHPLNDTLIQKNVDKRTNTLGWVARRYCFTVHRFMIRLNRFSH